MIFRIDVAEGDIRKSGFLIFIKSCFLGLFLCAFAGRPAQAQSFLTYEIDGINKTGSFKDSLSRGFFLNRLVDSLQREGYLTAFIHSKTFSRDTLAAQVKTGERHHWIVLRRGNLDRDAFLKKGFEEDIFRGRPFDFNDLKKLFYEILDEAQNSGFPFASVRLDSIVSQENSIGAAIDFDPGPFITFDTVQVTGTSKIQPLFLSRLLGIVPGGVFSQKKIDRSKDILKNLPFVQAVGEPQLSFQNQEARLYLPLDDRRINSIDGIIGVLPNQTADNRILVTGQFDLALYNVGGRGRNYQLNWQRLSQYSQNLRIAAEEPMLLGSMIDLKASFSLLKEDTTFLNRDFRVDFGYKVSPAFSFGFFSRRQAGNLLSVAQWAESGLFPDFADFRYNSYGISMAWNRLDDVFWPRQGWFAEYESGIGNKKLLQNTGLPASAYQDVDPRSTQYYVTAVLERHVEVSPRWGILMRASAGDMDSRNLFLNDLFRLGGLRSLRGFNENFFFANRYVYANFEPRYYFDKYSYFLLFMDMGRIQNKRIAGDLEKPLSFGGGLSMETDGGVFSFIYALGQSSSQLLGFDFSKIHFGYTGRF